VSIPRCEDYTKNETFLQIRNVGQPFFNNDSMLEDEFLNSHYEPMPGAPSVQGSNAFSQTYLSSFATNRSRNGLIDEVIRPGPYREVLPCEDLCYSLMQSCPASMGFVCPYRGRGLEAGYGKRSEDGNLTCSYLGAVYYLNSSTRTVQPVLSTMMVTAAVIWALGMT
jgi:calcium channel MID1